MSDEPRDTAAEIAALQTLISTLQGLEPEARARLVETAATFFGLGVGAGPSQRRPSAASSQESSGPSYPPFSADLSSVSPKEFLLQKQPRSDVERIAVLAYYLTHYRNTPHFKTLDLSKLNTEAAQPKFSNTANSANNAVKQGYIVASIKGQRQISAAGEQFVNALPDRDAARVAMGAIHRRRRARKSSAAKKNTNS